jgi:phage shock protein C
MKHSRYEERSHRAYRDPEHGLIAGVCAGIAEHLGFSIWLTRLITVALAWFFTVPVIITYIVIAIVLPERPLHYGGEDERRFWQSHRHRS